METIRTVRRMALATAIAVALSPAAQAATLTVTNADDTGAGSLRAALETANGNGEADVVVFDGTFFSAATPRTIALGSELAITGDTTVTGPGPDVLTIDGQENVRIFAIAPIVTGIDVTLTGLALENGFGPDGGGCIRASGAHLTLQDSVLTGCSGGEGPGGALMLREGAQVPPPRGAKGGEPPASLTVRESRFAGNGAMSGGAISAQLEQGGGATFDAVAVEENSAFLYAGGMDLIVLDGDVEIVDSTISGNVAGGAGGGFTVVSYSTIRIEDSQITGNRMEVGSYSYGLYSYGGGAAMLGFGDVLITGTTIAGNEILSEPPDRKGDLPAQYAGAGGGLFVFPATAGHTISITGSHFTGNGAVFGGGLMMGFPDTSGPKARAGALSRHARKHRGKALDGTTSIVETRFVDNVGEFAGPAVAVMHLPPQQPPRPMRTKAVSPGFTFDRVTVSGNVFAGGPGPFAGAVTVLGDGWPVQFINSTLSGNDGGIAMASPFPPASSEPALLLDHTTVANNGFSGVSAGFSSSRKLGARWAKRLALPKDYPLPEINIAIRNSVLAGNGAGGSEADLSATPNTVQLLHSLVQTTQPSDFTGFQDGGGNQFAADPLLAPLALAGHPFLEVHVPQAGSPLIDGGDPAVAAATPPAIDQRGAQRIAGDAIDIGAVETSLPGVIDFDPAALTVSETGGTATLVAMRTGGADGAVSVTYSTADGSALDGADYTAASGTLSWEDGDDGPKSFEVPLINDTLVEADETFTASLSQPTGGATIGTGTATVTLTSEDVAPVGAIVLQTVEQTVNETAGTVTITASRSAGSNGQVTVDYATADAGATAGSDYTATSGTLIWIDGETGPKSFTVPIIDDALVENPETFQVALSNVTGGAQLGTSNGTVTIVSDDVPPPGTLAIAPTALSVNEPAGTATLNVTRSGGSAGAVSVNYATANGSALAGSDYAATAGTLTWADGDSAAKSIVVPIVDDTQTEADEQFSVNLTQPGGGASLGASAATVTIVSEDAAASGSLQFDGAGSGGMVTLRFNENGAPAAKAIVQIAVTRSGGSAGAASIDYATVDGSATAPIDYTATSGTLTWADGETGTRFIPVNIVEDGLAEPEENFRVVLSNAQGAGLGLNAQAQVVVIANGGASFSGAVTIPAGDTRSWLVLLGAMLAAAWAGLRRRS